jgi:hypothetical protein
MINNLSRAFNKVEFCLKHKLNIVIFAEQTFSAFSFTKKKEAEFD